VDILFQHIKFRLFKNKSQDNNDIFSEWRKSLSEWRKSLSKRRKWLSKGLFFSGIVSGDKIPSPRAPGIRNYGGHLAHFATREPGTRNDCALLAALFPDQARP
jgi:hypothetical protein